MILVTGITGGLAKDFSPEFLAQSVGIGRAEKYEKMSHYIQANIACKEDMIKVIAYIKANKIEISSILHMASCTDLNVLDSYMLSTNKNMTNNVIFLAQKLHIEKVVFISSPSVYARIQDREDISEQDIPAIQMTAYSQSKIDSEETLLSSDIPSVICLRPKAILGPYDKLIAPKFMRIARMPIIALPKRGNVFINTTDSRDVVSAIECALSSDIKRGVYNIAGNVIEIKQLISTVLDVFDMGSRIIIGIPNLSFLGKPFELLQVTCGANQTLNVSKAIRELGWTPQYHTIESIHRYKEYNL